MKVVAVVPMKLNNRRLPHKNTKSFTNGHPMCTYILKTLKNVKEIDEIYVYCSREEIRQYLPEGVSYRKRPVYMDGDEMQMNEILYEFSREVEADIYVMTHTTAPFIMAESISKGLQEVLSGEYDSAFAVKKIQDFLWMNGKPFNYEPDNIPRTQDLPLLYMETSGFYVYRSQVIRQWKRRIGKVPFFVEVGEVEGIDIDEPEDFFIADAVYNHMIQNAAKG